MLELAWIVFLVECFLALFFGMVFWHFWTHSAMKRAVAVRAIVVYASGCAIFLLLALLLPL